MIPNPKLVVSTIHALLREKSPRAYMNKDAVRYIFDNGLIAHVDRPGLSMQLTEKGAAYIQEHTASELEND